jgi:hypothetical protein
MKGLTIISLQDELKKELYSILKGLYFEDNNGKQVEINIFNQNLPPEVDDKIQSPFPYIVIRILSGVSPVDEHSEESIRVLILIGLRNSDKKYITHRDVLGIIQRIKQNLQVKGYLEHFVLSSDIEWSLSEEDEWPYSFGGMDMKFKTLSINREDDLT